MVAAGSNIRSISRIIICMTAQVTDEMVTAAQGELPGVWNRERIRRALTAALTHVPAHDTPIPATVTIHLLVDEQQLRAAALTAAETARTALPIDHAGHLDVAELRLTVAHDTGQPHITAHTPDLNRALVRPLELGSLADIARRLQVARSTVTGWTRTRETNHMPPPVSGDAYDLREIEAWYRRWKGMPDAAAQ